MIEFKQQHSLPSSEHQFSVLYGNGFTAIPHKHPSDMRVPVETFFFAVAHRFRIPTLQIVMSVDFIHGYILIASPFEISSESLLCFIDFEHCRGVASEHATQSILAFVISDEFFYIIGDVYDIKRLLCCIHLTIRIPHFSDYK